MLDYDYCFIGGICQALDNSKVKYHHCRTWFRLFLEDDVYSIESTKNGNTNEVAVYKGDNLSWCKNTKAPIVFQGTLQDFVSWLENISFLKQAADKCTYYHDDLEKDR